jgi:GTPase
MKVKMQRCSTIVILGEPNAGKSTLLNALIKEKIAPVHSKPQMTRKNLLGILTEGDHQLIFVDTPGLHVSKQKFNQYLLKDLELMLSGADVVLLLLDVEHEFPEILTQKLEQIKDKRIFMVMNKIDLPAHDHKLDGKYLADNFSFPIFPISAMKKHGLGELVKELKACAPEQKFLYDADDLTTATYREIASELLREKVMEFTHKEIPYQATTFIESYQESEKRITISANIIVNRESHKGIMIGKGGANLKRIEQTTHRELKELTGQHVRLKLHVKVDENWIMSDAKISEYL